MSSRGTCGKVLAQMRRDARVCLIPLRDEHIPGYLALSRDPVLVATMGWEPFAEEESARFRQYLQNVTVPYMKTGGAVAFSIVSTRDNTPVGFISLKGIHRACHGAEVALAIMNRDYRGHGLGTAALHQAATYGFTVLKLSLLALTVFADNTPAIRSYEKLGFIRTELLIGAWRMPDGTHRDMWVMELYRHSHMRACPLSDVPLEGQNMLSQAQQ